MDFTPDTPRAARTIAGRSVQVIQPFAEGQPLTEATAAMLNQTLAENFSNNLRKTITDGPVDEAGKPTGATFTDEQVQAIADDYMAKYQPGVRMGGGGTPRVTDPVEREARKIAKSKVLELVKAKNLKAKDVDVAGLTEALFEKNRDVLMKQGASVVKALEAAAAKASELDIGEVDLSVAAE